MKSYYISYPRDIHLQLKEYMELNHLEFKESIGLSAITVDDEDLILLKLIFDIKILRQIYHTVK